MSLQSKVNFIYKQLEAFEQTIRNSQVYNPKYQAEINRLKFHCHQLHADAATVDSMIEKNRLKPEHPIAEISQRIFLLTHEVGYLKESYVNFTQFERTAPATSGLFSSPSDAGSTGSPGGFSPPQSSSQSSWSSSQESNSSQGSSSSYSSNSSYGSAYSSPARNVPVFYVPNVYYIQPQPVAAPPKHVQQNQNPFNFSRRNYYY